MCRRTRGSSLPARGLGPGVHGWFTTRRGGDSRPPYAGANLGAGVGDDPATVAANRAGLARFVGAPVTWIRAVHGADVGMVDDDGKVRPTGQHTDGAGTSAPDRPHADPSLDALVTRVQGRALAALAADCVPVLLAAHDAEGRPLAVAAAHSGRRGVQLGVAARVVEVLQGLSGHTVRASIGPAICGRCYEVPEAMRAEVAALVPESWATTRQGTPALDLVAGVTAQLHRAGADVTTLGLCTLETPWLFSHRRDQPGGREAGVVVIGPGIWSHARDTPGGVPAIAPPGG
ncbi:polyphenol oxidase family protein [Salana multivorans]